MAANATCLICDRYDDVVFYINSFSSEAKYVLLLLTEVEPDDTDLLCFGCNGKLTISTSFFKICSTSEKCQARKAILLEEEQSLVKFEDTDTSSHQDIKSEKYEETIMEGDWIESEEESNQNISPRDTEQHNIVDMNDIEVLEEDIEQTLEPPEHGSLRIVTNLKELTENSTLTNQVKESEMSISEVEIFEFEITDDGIQNFETENLMDTKAVQHNSESVISELSGKSKRPILKNHLVQEHGPIRHSIQRNLVKIKEGDIYSDAGFDDFTCSFCFDTFNTTDERTSHEESHKTETRPFKCFVCSLKFQKRSRLKEHYETHQNNSYTCSIEGCNKVFKSKHGKWAHEYKHKTQQVTCSTCGKTLSTNWALNLHIKTVHTELPLNYVCEVCNKRFKSQKALYGHSLLHDPKNKKHECSHCLKKFLTKSKLERHMRHHTGEKPFSCTRCHYKGTNNYNLKRHLMTHGINMFDSSTKIGSKEEILVQHDDDGQDH